MNMATLSDLPIYVQPKFQEPKQGIKRNWYDAETLFHASEKILEWFYNDEFGIIIVHGQQGWGKSCYATTVAAEVYGHVHDDNKYYHDWDAVKKHIVWKPEQFLALSRKKQGEVRNKERMVIWDDAGYWLNAMDYRDKLCVAISKFIEVARSRWGCIMFTVTNQQQLLSKIRNIPHAWSIPISKIHTPSLNNPNYKWNHTSRFARLHKSWCSEDLKKSGKRGKEGDLFHARMPPKFYNWYRDWRESFTDEALDEIERIMNNGK